MFSPGGSAALRKRRKDSQPDSLCRKPAIRHNHSMRQQILDEIRRLANGNGGKAPGVQAFERDTGIRRSTWLGRYWARWGDAVSEAGFETNDLQQKTEEAFL